MIHNRSRTTPASTYPNVPGYPIVRFESHLGVDAKRVPYAIVGFDRSTAMILEWS